MNRKWVQIDVIDDYVWGKQVFKNHSVDSNLYTRYLVNKLLLDL